MKYCSEPSHYCASPYCQEHAYRWEGKQYGRLIQGEASRAHRLILPIGELIPPPMLAQLWRNFSLKLRRLARPADCEWFWVLEYQSGLLHYHVIVTTEADLAIDEVKDKWVKCLKKKGLSLQGTVRVDEVFVDYDRLAGYNLKHKWHNSVAMRPPFGLYRYLAGASRGFGRRV